MKFVVDDAVARCPFGDQPIVEPARRRHYCRILVAKALREFDGEGRRPGRRGKAGNDGRIALRTARNGAENLAGKQVGRFARILLRDDGLGQTAQIFDQRDPQRDGQRPKLADVERLYALIGLDKVDDSGCIDGAVAMRDQRPGNAENPRIALERAIGELGQPAVETVRQVGLDLAQLFIDDMEVIEQPTRRRADRLARRAGGGNRLIGSGKNLAVVVKPRR